MLLVLTVLAIPHTSASTTCACGNKKVLLVLAEFPGYRHLSSRADISRLFFSQVARYYLDVSYGKLSTTGNATDWISLPRLYDQYVRANQFDLSAVALDSFSIASSVFNFTSFDDVLLILSYYPSPTADYVSLPIKIVTKSGNVASFAVLEEDRDWTVYARGYALTLGLWRFSARIEGLGQFDTVSAGQGDLSGWSKINLGWINDSQIETFVSPPIGHVVTLDSLEIPRGRTYVLQMGLPQSEGFYQVEARQSMGYDRDSLPEYGLVVLYVPPDNSSLQIRAVLEPNNVGKAIFLDPASDLSIIALNQTQTGFSMLVGSVQDGRDAHRALYAISRADDAIHTAQVENRIDGLDLSQRLLANARALFLSGRFRDAEPLALSAVTTAESAVVPADYSSSVQLITQAESLRSQSQSIVSGQSIALVMQGNVQLDVAKQAFVGRNFTLAKQHAQSAVDLYNRAKQIEATEKILSWLGSFALVIPIIILAYALRYQLKN